jgi:acetyltransferase-like isoleucine patch superfamily enzyme
VTSTSDPLLFGDLRRKRWLNQLYVDLVVWLHRLLFLLPGPLRNAAFRLVLGTAGPGLFVDHEVYVKFPWLVHVGTDVSLNRGVEFYADLRSRSGIHLGDDVYVGPRARFHASGHDVTDLRVHVGAPIVVGDGVWIGAGAVLLPGVEVGAGAVVAAQAVVTRDVAAGAIVAGVPAREIGIRSAAREGPDVDAL